MATDGASRVCPECSKPLAPGQAFCASCGAPLSPPISTQMGRNLPPDSWDTVAEADDRARNHPLAMSRTRTGLLLAIIGFALAWIPFAGGVGGLILLIGVVFLWLGRRGFGADHHRNVTAGGVCILLALLLGIGVGVWFASSLVSAAGAAGATPASVGATLTSDLGTLLEVSVATTALISVGYLLLPVRARRRNHARAARGSARAFDPVCGGDLPCPRAADLLGRGPVDRRVDHQSRTGPSDPNSLGALGSCADSTGFVVRVRVPIACVRARPSDRLPSPPLPRGANPTGGLDRIPRIAATVVCRASRAARRVRPSPVAGQKEGPPASAEHGNRLLGEMGGASEWLQVGLLNRDVKETGPLGDLCELVRLEEPKPGGERLRRRGSSPERGRSTEDRDPASRVKGPADLPEGRRPGPART